MDNSDSLSKLMGNALNAANVTYVLGDVEVRKTGRTAERVLRSGKIDVTTEVTPVDSCVGSWKKWVHSDELFIVKE